MLGSFPSRGPTVHMTSPNKCTQCVECPVQAVSTVLRNCDLLHTHRLSGVPQASISRGVDLWAPFGSILL
jgi:hypothetical protein